MSRRWRVHLSGQHAEALQAGATISFRWDPFDSARSYTCEEDLQTELFGRRAGRSTQPRLVRVDLTLRATLPGESTTPMPAPDVWAPWIDSMEEQLDAALTRTRRVKDAVSAWRGDLEIDGRSTPDGTISFQGMSVPAFEMIVVPRVWDDPKRRAREPSAAKQIDGLARRFRAAWDAWTASVGELAKWLRYASVRPRARAGRRPFPDDRDAGPETKH